MSDHPAARGPRRAAYTLVEVAVAFLVAVVVVGIAWTLWRMADKSFHSSRKRLTSLQGAFLLMERFCTDLRQSYVDQAHPVAVTGQERLDFTVFDPTASDLAYGTPTPAVARRAMVYRHDKASGLFTWKDGAAGERAFKAAPFECILYYKPTQETPPVPWLEYVSFRITCAAEDDFDSNRGKGDLSPERRTKEVVTLITAVGLEQRAGEVAFPWWRQNRLPETR